MRKYVFKMRKYVAETSDRGAHSPATRLCDGPLETGRWCLWTLVRPRGAALGATAPYGTVHATPSIHEPAAAPYGFTGTSHMAVPYTYGARFGPGCVMNDEDIRSYDISTPDNDMWTHKLT